MRYLSILATSLLLSGSLFSQWTPLSSDGYAINDALNSVLKFHPGSYEPYVMLQDNDPFVQTDVVIRRFNGTDWVDVGGGPIGLMVLTTDHIDFGFDPANSNSTIAYFHTGYDPIVAQESGASWEAILGLEPHYIDYSTGFAFDVSPAGNPTLAYPDYLCQIPGSSEYGPISVITHEQEWGFVVAPCQSIRPAVWPSMEYNDYDDKLMVFHSGGPDPDMNFTGERWLLDYNVSTTEPLEVAEFVTDYTIGHMLTNPVNGDTYVYTIEPPTTGSSDRLLTLQRWGRDFARDDQY